MTLHEELKVRALSASFGALITSLAGTNVLLVYFL